MLYRRSWVSTAGPALHVTLCCNVAPWHDIRSTSNSVGRPVRTCSSALACSAAHRRAQAGCWEHARRRRQGVRGCCVGCPWQTSGGIPVGCRECKQAPESVMCSALLDLSAWEALQDVSSCSCILAVVQSEKYGCAGGGLAFAGYLMLLCQVLIACGEPQNSRSALARASGQQYKQLSTQDEGDEKSEESQRGGLSTLELTATAADPV